MPAGLFGEDATPPAPRLDAAFYVQVAVERGVDAEPRGFTYAVPEGVPSLGDLGVGDRVTVPLGRGDKPVQGFVVAVSDDPPAGVEAAKIKPVRGRLGLAVKLPADLVGLAGWMSRYYACPIGMTLATMLPASVKHGTGVSVRRSYRAAEGKRGSGEAEKRGSQQKTTKLQRAILESAGAGWVERKELLERAGAKTAGPLQKLLEAGRLEERSEEVVTGNLDAVAPPEADAAQRLEPAQRDAVNAIVSRFGSFHVDLLHGVTGSGKTEVYLQAIAKLRELEPQACVLVLVPEIALTPQTVGRFAARFGGSSGPGAAGVAVLHSGLTPGQRHAHWRRVSEGTSRIVIGARSAVFAPLPRLDLVIVDEEHDTGYKQDQLPRYHGRDVAIKRAAMAAGGRGCPVVLGSATPALESYARALPGKRRSEEAKKSGSQAGWSLLSLPDRVAGAKLPRVEVVDLARERRERKGVHLLSRRLEAAIAETLDGGGQVVLLLNRRGYANYIACPDAGCGWLLTCDHCDALGVYHRHDHVPAGRTERVSASGFRLPKGNVRCHHCGAERRLPTHCPDSGHKLSVFGMGTQRTEEELIRKFPGLLSGGGSAAGAASVTRMDADAMRSAADYQRALAGFVSGETEVLLGTQMIAKGLDVANVRLVGVVSADTALNLPDFRAAERTFQLIAQVAGRAGRGRDPGTVIVQTLVPEDATIASATRHDYAGFAERELGIREEAGLPPFTRMARVVCRDLNRRKAEAAIGAVHAELVAADAALGTGVAVTPPAPCAIERVADHFRFDLRMTGADAGAIQKLLAAVRSAGHLTSNAAMAVDVDPVSMY
ncbi:replication restart helicase PriA [Phycisphaera mikurensis]|uniref:Replication restart protein PriA n=1 Tax=Phycisphaera mikurensis (strain NBRC 102666 / KCTC 22515 / FYK2301M01) TaxID=1142394 RepID=I0IH68_PHYMF|nr:primosomal protein N' [Phycisphaera mikurensis]MBB6440857.1 primosomal protein N' (replication factor Y) [Phycisphaera mikurensis]BAM04606.1 primosomal protein N' [Phycisphaera mikurensis NBRC 102666]